MKSTLLAKVKNGKGALKLIRNLRKNGIRVIVYGRHPDRQSFAGKTLSNGKKVPSWVRDVPREFAKELAIYTY